MNICEIFYSLQGESTYAGLPCVFIRLTDCNLRCNYCDTQYSYDKSTELSIDEIILEIAQYNCTLVEITGGEPLLQIDAIELMERLEADGYTVLLETNGSQTIQPVPNNVHIIIDVKTPSSGHPDSFYQPNLQWLKEGWDEIKFVVSDRADFDFALHFIETHKLQHHTMLISPVTDKLDPSVLAAWIMESGLPLRLNLQLHKILNLR
jgi:7-carboxy-7-deazaguanine synthase